jgi:hypothetical protein
MDVSSKILIVCFILIAAIFFIKVKFVKFPGFMSVFRRPQKRTPSNVKGATQGDTVSHQNEKPNDEVVGNIKASKKAIANKNQSASDLNLDPHLRELLLDPAFKGFWKIIVRRKGQIQTLLKWLDKSEIWLGVTAGLTAMSAFAVVYTFWENTINNPNHFAAISYAVFFVFVSIGLYKYISRRTDVQRVELKLRTALDRHESQIRDWEKRHSDLQKKLENNQVDGATKTETVIEQNQSLHIRNEQLTKHNREQASKILKLESELKKFTKIKPTPKLKFWK